jgi:outer membrane protein TolC
MRLFRTALIIGIILCSFGFSLAEELEREAVYMSLHEALSIAVTNNFDVQLNLYDRWIKDTDINKARSIYDTLLELTGDYEYDKSKKPTIILGRASHTGSAGAKLTKKLITGTDLTIDWQNQRMSTDSVFTAINPYYESSLEMKFTQPLLKNFLGMNDWGEVRITKIDVYNFNLETLDKIEEDLADVEKAYWDVLLAKQLVEVGNDMYDRALEFYEINKRKKDLGTAELTDLLDAEANMKARKSDFAIDEDTLKTAVNKLKLLLNYPQEAGDILPVETVEFSVRKSDFHKSLKTAFENRRDYKSAKEDIKAENLNFNLKRNARWPELDFEGSLKLNGLGPLYKSATAKSFTDDNPVYKATVTFTLPFEDNLGRSEYDAAKYEKAKALVTLKKTERTIVTEIDDAVRSVNLNRDTAELRLNIEDLQKRKLEEENKQFGIGRSDSNRVIRFQEDLLQARILALRALRNYKDSLIDLYVTENTYMDRRRLTVK